MTEAGDEPRDATGLEVALSADQLTLLKIIWDEIARSGHGGNGVWPTWDYVERVLEREAPELDPNLNRDLLRSLPKVGPSLNDGRRYGLVWVANFSEEPSSDDVVGLTIAGVARLADAQQINPKVVEAIVGVVAMLADWEKNLQPDPTKTASELVRLHQFTSIELSMSTMQKPTALADSATSEMLNHEYNCPFTVWGSNGDWLVNLGGSRLRAYRGVQSGRDYLGAIRRLESKRLEIARASEQDEAGKQMTIGTGSTIFIVHGHDEATKHHVVRVVEQATGRTPTILHEQANMGRTVLEKFKSHAANAAVAIVLLTPDDHGSQAGKDALNPRARQNVVFELGYFFGLLGHQRVIALSTGNVELPSDLNGLIYISKDDGDWKRKLCQELAQIEGLDVDMNKVTA